MFPESTFQIAKGCFVKTCSTAWRRERGNLITGTGVIPEKVRVDVACSEICSRCIGSMPDCRVTCRAAILGALKIATTCPGNSYDADMTILHCLPKDSESGFSVLCTSHLKSPSYSAEFVLLQPERLGGGHLPGQRLGVVFEDLHGYHLPAFLTEIDLACKILDAITDAAVARFALHGIGAVVSLQKLKFHFVNLSVFCIEKLSDVQVDAGIAEEARGSLARKASRSFLNAIRPLPSRKHARRRRKQGSEDRSVEFSDRRVRRVQGQAEPTGLSVELSDRESVVMASGLDHWSDAHESECSKQNKSDDGDGDKENNADDGDVLVNSADPVSDDSDDLPLSRLVVPSPGASRILARPVHTSSHLRNLLPSSTSGMVGDIYLGTTATYSEAFLLLSLATSIGIATAASIWRPSVTWIAHQQRGTMDLVLLDWWRCG